MCLNILTIECLSDRNNDIEQQGNNDIPPMRNISCNVVEMWSVKDPGFANGLLFFGLVLKL